jgi:hypothetical protein
LQEFNLIMEKFALAKKISRKFYWIKRNLKPIHGSHIKKVIFFRVIKPICDLYYLTYKKLNTDTPWTSPASIEILKLILTKEMKGFEFGSGGSTIFYSKRIKELTTVEHNQDWYNQINRRLVLENIKNVNYRFFQQEDTESFNEEVVNIGNKTIVHNFQKNFYEYVKYIDSFDDGYFDFIVVDGRARVDCIIRSINKLKTGGILILDNSERERYKQVHELLIEWPSILTSTGLTDTTIWFKK